MGRGCGAASAARADGVWPEPEWWAGRRRALTSLSSAKSSAAASMSVSPSCPNHRLAINAENSSHSITPFASTSSAWKMDFVCPLTSERVKGEVGGRRESFTGGKARVCVRRRRRVPCPPSDFALSDEAHSRAPSQHCATARTHAAVGEQSEEASGGTQCRVRK